MIKNLNSSKGNKSIETHDSFRNSFLTSLISFLKDQSVPLVIGLLLIFGIGRVEGQTLTTDNFGPTTMCPGDMVSVGFNVTGGSMNAGNVFRVQLSDAAGNFPDNDNSSNVIGTLTSSAPSGTISATFPSVLPPGTNYRVRVVSTDPVLNNLNASDDDNGNDLTVQARTITPDYSSLNATYDIGGSISVNYTVNCLFIPGNHFILELSDATGNFTSPGYPLTLDDQTTNANGTLSGTIPSVPSGSGYRVRVRATNPAVTSVVSAAFAINPDLVASDCACNNDQTPNNDDGTYSVTLTIRNGDNSAMASGLSYRVTAGSGVVSTSKGSILNALFTYCNGIGCPSGVSSGEYYLVVYVTDENSFSIDVDGPDGNNAAELFLVGASCDNADRYPALPVFPAELMGEFCMPDVTFSINNPSQGVFSEVNSLSNIQLPSGFSQTVTPGPGMSMNGGAVNLNNNDLVQADNNPYYDLYMISQAENGCRMSAFNQMNIYKLIRPALGDVGLYCSSALPTDSVDLSIMLAPENEGGFGTYEVLSPSGVTVVNGKIVPEHGTCYHVRYTVVDSCGVSRTAEAYLQTTFKPKPAFDFSGAPVSPVCTTDAISFNVTRTSTGQNPVYSISSNNASYPGSITSGGVVTLPQIPEDVSVIYNICLTETNDAVTTCGSLVENDTCATTVCRKFVIYRDRYNCGADNLFASQCVENEPDLCPTDPTPGLNFSCSFFQINSPDILTSEVNFSTGVAGCKDEFVEGDFEVSFFGLNPNALGGGKKIKDFPGIGTVCDVLNFEILGWRPLAPIYELLGCDKTILQFILGIISNIAGGDGGGYLVMADTDSDGVFDYLVDQGDFPGTGTFQIPNNVKGSGYISVRAVGGWVNSPIDMCGDFGVEGVNLLDLLPIGSIPIVGPPIKNALESAGCSLNIAFSAEATEKIKVLNNEPANYMNCNPGGYVFSQTLDCNIPVNWSVPVALDGCTSEAIAFRGFLTNPTTDPTLYAGTTLPQEFSDITEPGIYQIAGPLPGSNLMPGIYTVTYQAVSCNGIPSLCSFDVVVTSGEPILECPRDITVAADIDGCSRAVNGLAPYQGIGCASIINYRFTNPVSGTVVETNSTTIGTHNIPDGYEFELGTTVITYTMLVDINGDGDYADPSETQICSFSITVEDRQLPHAVCLSVELHLNNEGLGTVYASSLLDSIYIDGGSTDNCGGSLVLEISEDNVNYFPSLDFDCADKGNNVINFRVTDESGNTSYCKAVVKVLDYFEGYRLDMDVPEVCFDPFQDTFDFSPYIVIAQPNGTNIRHQDVGTLGPEIVGAFGISAFLPDPGSTADPGTITTDGLYTIGTGTGWVTISYILSINEQVNQINDTTLLTGCYRMVHDVFRVQKLDPTWEGGFMCCDQLPVWLGGANWDGTGDPVIPAGMLSLRDIRGDYPKDAYGEWIGQGVSFVDPDGVNFTGDEFYQFDPNGLDGDYTITYVLADEPCEFKYSQVIRVTCQDLHVDISDYTVCPANWVEEKQVLINLDDKDIVVSTTGFDEIGAAGGHYADGTPVTDLDSVVAVDGRVVIPGFFAPAVRDEDYEICVTTFQVTPFGCADIFCYTITVQDLEAPQFQNCPRAPVVVDAPAGWCSSFVNFEYPWAVDNCMGHFARIEQVDSTGLKSGDLFPVGLTILAYTATDTVGNQSYCELKVIVNDYHTPPSIACPDDVTQSNDLGKCGAVVNNIAPVDVVDNCPDNLAIIYEVTGPDGEVIKCGAEDASGDFFPVGTSSVKYRVEDQPLLLITEIVQDGVTTGMEITNFGPADMDITCSTFYLKDENGVVLDSFMVPTRNNKSTYGSSPIYPPDPIVWVVPNPNVIPVGGTFTHTFNVNRPAGAISKYCFTFLNRLIDEATINDIVDGNVILRKDICDHDLQTDFIAATPCDPGSFGLLNPGLPTMTPNGTVRGLQNYAPSVDECTFKVTIQDVEAPVCIKHDSIRVVNTEVPISIAPNTCMVSTITMPAGVVDDVNIHDLQVQIADAGAVTAYLSSPSGTRILLFDDVCAGQPNIDVTLDNTIVWTPAPSIISALCTPLGQGGIYRPEESFKAFYGEEGGGDWILEIFTKNNVSGTLNNWELEILYRLPYDQPDVVLENDPGRCDAEFSWIHPIMADNCAPSTITVTFTFTNSVTGETSTETVVILNENGTINLQGLLETRIFEVGVTYVEYTLTDIHGNLNTCGFTVTVNDTEEPEFAIPGCPDRVINLGPGECYGVLIFTPKATDNCALLGITFWFEDGTPADLSHLPIGTYNIIAQAEDIYGNIGTCTFQVTVVEYVPKSNTLACNDQINLSLGPDCEAVILPDMLLEGNDYRCFENYCVTIEDLFGIPHPNLFTQEDEGKTFKVSIKDCDSTDPALYCWGYVIIEEKLLPEIECPDDITVTCNFDVLATDTLGNLLTGMAELKSCEDGAVISWQDDWETFGICDNPRAIVHRIWTVRDSEGNKVECTQTITVAPLSLDDVDFPSDIEFHQAINCADVVDHPELTQPNSTGWPTLNHIPVNKAGSLCMISINYTDEIYDICDGSYEILRYWKVRNMCLPVTSDNPRQHVQVIKVLDTKGPKIVDCPVDITVSVNPWNCRAALELPQPGYVGDACSEVAEFKYIIYGGGHISNYIDSLGVNHVEASELTIGVYTIKYTYKDKCGNISTCSFKVRVIDASPPVVVTKQNIVVSLTNGSSPEAGTAKLYAWQVDNGSYDHCTDVILELRRIGSNVPSCGNVGNNGTNNNVTYNHSPSDNLPGVWAHPEDTRGSTVLDTDNGEFVMFCCEDIPADSISAVHQVELRVWDDGNQNGIVGDNLEIDGVRDNYNTTWADIRVENKFPPQIVCPPDVTVTCDMELNLSEGVDTPIDSVDLTMTGIPTVNDICGTLHATYRDVVRRGDCDNVTRIDRTFKVTKGIGANSVTVQCRQIITVEWIEVPFVVTFGSHNGKEPWDKCEFSIDDVRGGSILIKKPTVVHGPCDIVGENIKIDTFLFEDGACKKWRVEYNYINWCTGDQRGPFVYYYYYKDEIAPNIECPADQEFAATVDPANPNDGCLADVVLKASASDSLKCAAESWVKWQVFFDGWANGTVDRLASSFVDKTKYGRPAGQGAWFPVPRLVNGQLNPEWVRLQNAHPGVVLEDLVYVTYVIPSKASGEEITLPSFKLPNEQIWHKILWKVTDGCGNVAQCQSRVKAIDKKPPTPYCVHISTALMRIVNPGDAPMVELWAKDFDKGAFDNCTPQSKLYFTFDGVAPIYTKITEEHYYKAGPNGDSVEATASEYASGRAYKWLPSVRSAGKIWTTAGEFDVKVSVWDEAWNTDFCDVDLKVINNNGVGTLISGNISTEDRRGIQGVQVIADANLPEYPKTELTNSSGDFSMGIYVNTHLSAAKNDDYLNGVTTLDLVIIQRHILGLQLLNSPYKIIASDATDNGKITAADLSEIRKLILGIKEEYSNNSSWRFVVKEASLDASKPFPFTESVIAPPDSSDVYDFVAVKIGDVNGSAKVNAASNSIETRSNDRVVLAVNEAEVEAGEVITLPVTAEQYNNVAGFQYTMKLNGAEYLGIESGALDVDAKNVGNLGNGVVTMSYSSAEPVSVTEGEVLFTIRAKATKAMKVSEMMTLNSAVTAAESYNGNLEVGRVALAVRTAPVASIELYQNEPNPFKGETTVSFMMPEAGIAKLSVYDMTGRQIAVRTIEAVKGLNSEVFTKAQLGVSGVLYYTLESGDFTATKKMIIVE